MSLDGRKLAIEQDSDCGAAAGLAWALQASRKDRRTEAKERQEGFPGREEIYKQNPGERATSDALLSAKDIKRLQEPRLKAPNPGQRRGCVWEGTVLANGSDLLYPGHQRRETFINHKIPECHHLISTQISRLAWSRLLVIVP